MIMNWRLSVAAVAVLIALGGIAEADVLTAGPVYAGPGQLNGRVLLALAPANLSPRFYKSEQ
jgi:hypothetical protein